MFIGQSDLYNEMMIKKCNKRQESQINQKGKKKTAMQMHLPSPQQIYDMSTQQLTNLQSQLQHTIASKRRSSNNNTHITNQLQSLTQLLENIALQIEQRKTIEFFTELCISDGTANKYVKQITDFNNEFKKLANEMLNNQLGDSNEGNINQKKYDMTVTDKAFRNLDTQDKPDYQDKQNSNSDRKPSQTSITTNSFSKQNHTIGTESSDFTTSATSQMKKKAASTITKKMGVGHNNMKKNKNSMQQFIKATLAKSKAVDYVSTKGGSILKKSPDNKIHTNGSHVSHHEIATTPLSTTKSIKPPSQGSDTGSHSRKQAPSLNKTIPASQKSINQRSGRDSLIKKRNDAIEKMKTMKKPQTQGNTQNLPPQPKKKGVKGLDAKSLVEMVKHEQDAKKKREQEPVEERKKPKQQKKPEKNEIEQKKQEKEQKLTEIQSQQLSNKQITKSQTQEQIKPEKQTLKQNTTSKTSQKQNEFPIKQEINAVSSSDTESDTDSVKLSGGSNPKRMSSKKETIMKDDKYYSIPEEEIEESIVFVKENVHGNNNSIGSQQVPSKKEAQFQTSHVSTTKTSPKHLENKIQEAAKKQQVKKSTVQTKTQNFGRITQEYYNPNGYDDTKSDDEEQTRNNNEASKQQQPKEDSQQQDQTEPQQTNTQTTQTKKQQVPKGSTTKKTSQKSQKKGSSKNLKPKKQQKKTVLDQQIVSPNLTDFQSNKMYNQQYWLHIKEQAQTKIQRFKQEKQIQRKERQLKAKLIEQESKRIKIQLQLQKGVKKPLTSNNNEQKSTTTTNLQSQLPLQPTTNRNIQTPITLQDDDNDKFIQQQRNNLKKIQAQNNTNGSSKKTSKKPQPSLTLIKQPKPSYPKPQFNYLQLYPTFNHIFNVFYTKPQSQALLDIPLIMKQMIQMFQSHVQYQKSRKNNFRPAIFMPFDNRNSKMNQFNDARALLQHAETTYVNLKTLIERVEIFNSNIQGEFENYTEEERQRTQFYRVVKTKEEVYDIITTSFLRRKGWKQLPHGQNLKANWNLFWSWSKPQIDMNKLIVFQRINHYPFNKNLSRKDLLYKNIDSFRKTHKVPFPYLPVTYNLPKQFTQFSKRFHEQQLVNREKNYWIMKPIGKSRGRGIKLINSLGDLNYLDNIVVQKYISNPLLIDGYKFDMRIYVLVTSFHPLQAFVYRQGFARFSTEKYSLEPMDMKNNFVHLTNFAINRHNQQANQQFTQGSKISLKSLKQKITKMGYSFASVWFQIHQIIIKSLLACSVSVPPFPAAFELFGYDIMLDDTGQCSLIEINASPSLQRSYMIDDIIKQSLIDDIIEIVNPSAFSKEQAINVMTQRLSPEFRNYKKGQKGANVDEQDLIHLARILKYQKMRKYGEMPQKIGLFEMVAPSPMSKDLEKLIKSKSGINAPHNID